MTSHLATCSTCQRRCAVVVVSSVKVAGRWVQWFSCSSCEQADEARWQEQRQDEAREREQAQERAQKTEQRDKDRNEKRKATA